MVNRKRRRKKRVNEGIKVKEWEKYFKKLLGGINNRVVRGLRREVGRGLRREDEKKSLDKEEIRKVIKSMKDRKASGMDGIPAEVWKY